MTSNGRNAADGLLSDSLLFGLQSPGHQLCHRLARRFVLVQDCIHSKEFYRDAHFVLLNYTCRCTGEPVVQLNDEAREFRWTTLKEALALPLNQPTRKLLLAVAAGSETEPHV